MKTWSRALLVLTFAGTLLTACETGEVYISPALVARVVDSNTGLPIGNAKVTMWSGEVPESRAAGTTDNNGNINLPRLKGRLHTAFPFVADRIEPEALARFEAAGYAAKEINSTTDPAYFDGTRPVRLDPH